MNNSFDRLVDGMVETLRHEVLPRIDDDFARGQVFGVVNLLNTFKARADWSAGFLRQQIAAQEEALRAAGEAAPAPVAMPPPMAADADIDALLARRDALNAALAAWLDWLESAPTTLPPATAAAIDAHLRRALRAEVDLELRHAPRPLFAEMSSGREG